MSTSVKWCSSTMEGAPQLTDAWGCMTTLLDAVLVNGFNNKLVDSLVSSNGIATLGITAGHGFIIDQIISISGANESDYNGEFRVTNITTNSLSFAISNSAPSVATGTINVKTAPLGWDLVFSSTNKRAYRSKNVLSNKPFLRVDDDCDPVWNTTYAKYAKVTMAEKMTDIDTFIGARAPYDPINPTKNEIGSGSGTNAYGGWYKWYYARRTDSGWGDGAVPDAFNRHWVLIGDDRGFYLFNEQGLAGRARAGRCFSDFNSFKQDDKFNTILIADDIYVALGTNHGRRFNNTNNFAYSLDPDGKILMRDHLGIGGTQRVSFTSLNTNNGQTLSGLTDSIPYPNPSDYGLFLHPIFLMQEGVNKGIRGEMSGLFWIHNTTGAGDLSIFDSVPGYPNRKFMVVAVAIHDGSTPTKVAIDITGPWR